MTLVLDLKDDLDQKLEAVARQEGKTVSELIGDYLEELVEKKNVHRGSIGGVDWGREYSARR